MENNYNVNNILGENRQEISQPYVIGVLPGEGIGPDIIQLCLNLLDTIQAATKVQFDIQIGGDIGKIATSKHGVSLTNEVKAFCSDIFGRGGVLFCGPGGDRFVYDLRKEFELFCKFAPIVPVNAVVGAGPIQESRVKAADILIIRENLAGIYQGQFGFNDVPERNAWHQFGYTHQQIFDIMLVAKNAANHRRKKVAVVTKPGGVPTISDLWKDVANEVFAHSAVSYEILEVDNACYQIIANPGNYDVVVTPNLFGDVVGDVAALLLGSRGMSYSANYAKVMKAAVYQTSHGAAHDLAGKDVANPIGQILSLAMLLEQSFALVPIAQALRDAVEQVLSKNIRTRDLSDSASVIVGTKAMGELIQHAFYANLEKIK
ncbi:MAG: isocitrate/isopropylmalate family dehydrogenase [Chitinophagaceae bacterium]